MNPEQYLILFAQLELLLHPQLLGSRKRLHHRLVGMADDLARQRPAPDRRLELWEQLDGRPQARLRGSLLTLAQTPVGNLKQSSRRLDVGQTCWCCITDVCNALMDS